MKTLQYVTITLLALVLTQSAQGQLLRRLRGNRSSGQSRSVSVAQPSTPQEKQLIKFITQAQEENVKESWGQQDWQCFTDDDYRWFQESRVTSRIVEVLREDEVFMQLVSELRQLDAGERSRVLSRAARTYKSTWAQYGRISRNAQTNAGQRAESDIAAAIVRLVKELLSRAEVASSE